MTRVLKSFKGSLFQSDRAAEAKELVSSAGSNFCCRYCKRTYIRCYTRHPVLFRYRVLLLMLVILLMLLLGLHFLLLPKVTGAYNDDCYLPVEKLENLRYAVQKISQAMEKHNKTYWLDYGTLLGAMQYSDILPWDGDADVSYLYDPYASSDEYKVVHESLSAYGINSNGLQARYNGMSIDYFRWKLSNGTFEGKYQTLLNKYYPRSVLDNDFFINRIHHKLEYFPLSWILPTKKIDFHGVKVTVPSAAERLLAHHYPYSYPLGVNVPYKWKCYIPCPLKGFQDCKQPISSS